MKLTLCPGLQFLFIFQITVLISGPVMKEIAKNPPVAADDKNAASAKGKGKGGKDEKKDAVKEKPKRKGPLDVLPTIVEEWAQYDLPDEVRNADFAAIVVEYMCIDFQRLWSS